MKKNEKIGKLLLDSPLWTMNQAPIWIASNFLLRRNLSSHLFPSKMSKIESQQVIKLLIQSLIKSSKLSYIVGDELTQIEKELLFEHFFSSPTVPITDIEESYVIDQNGSFLASFNQEDHLLLQYIEPNSDWKEGWKKLLEIESALSKELDFAFSTKFGYLSSNPMHVGTGLRVQAYLHLPCLIHLGKINELLVHEEVQIKGIGSSEEFIGDIVIIENKYSIGLTENQILQNVHKVATLLISNEKNLRDLLTEERYPFFLNQISCYFGILRHAFQMDIKEAFTALSFIKLGIDLKWISGVDEQKINKIFFSCQRAHLISRLNEEIPQEQLNHYRAKFLQEELQTMSLHIP